MTPRQLLGKARTETFKYVPYLCSYIYSLREQETPGIGTGAVDEAGNLYWDPAFVTEIGKEQAAYLVAHEVLHLIFNHHSRSREIIGDDPTDFQRFVCNVAGDLVIEQTLHMMRHLRPEGAVYLGCEVPAWGIQLDFPENKSMQEYYRLIMEKLQQQSDEQQQQRGSDGGGGDSDGKAAGKEQKAKGSGSPSAGVKQPQKPGAPGTGGSCADGCPRPYEVEDDGTWQAYGEDMAAAAAEEAIAKYEEQNPGKVPGNIKEAIRHKLRPQPDPFDQLRSAVCTSVASPVGGRDYSHRRRSRKQPPGDDAPLLHGRITVQPNAVVIVDTSGSMNKDAQARALSVIGQGLRKLGRVKVYCADTHVRSHQLVATTRVFEWAGGGGTDMSTAIEQVEREDEPDSIVLITDAETHWRCNKPHARVVVAYTGKKGSQWHRAIPAWFRVVPLAKEGG